VASISRQAKSIDDQQIGANILREDAIHAPVQLGAVQFVEHLWCRDEDHASGQLTGLVRERPGEEGLSGARNADKKRVDALIEKGQVVQREVATTALLAISVEVEVETVDGALSSEQAEHWRNQGKQTLLARVGVLGRPTAWGSLLPERVASGGF